MRYALIRSLGLMGGFLVGGCLPCLAAYSGWIKIGLVVMLFAVYLRLEPSWRMFRWSQAAGVLFGIVLSVVSWLGFSAAGCAVLAQVAFFTAITPTATAAPVIVGLLGGDVAYAVAMFLVSSVGVSLVLPVLIPWVVGSAAPGVVGDVLWRMVWVVGAPMGAAGIVRLLWGERGKALGRALGPMTFYVWIGMVVLIAAQARAFVDGLAAVPWGLFAAIGGVSLALCVINFLMGYWLGRPQFSRECSQALGQKNNSFSVYLALVYADPLVALGPTVYVLWHNIWNAVQLYRCARRQAPPTQKVP